MKFKALALALALIGGAALAQAPNESARAVAPTTQSSMHHASGHHAGKHHMARKMAARHHRQHVAQARHHRHHMAMAHHRHHMARMERREMTNSMGAGPTDLSGSSREQRMTSAYADWQHRR